MKRSFINESEYPSKITIFGTPGSGKTTLAKQLEIELNIPLYHLDKILWEKGWKLRDKEDFLKDQFDILKLDHWIIEGTAISSLAYRFQKSDVVIFLFPSRLVCIYRVFKRLLTQKVTPADKVEGNKERITWEFIKYLWNFERKAKQRIQELAELYPSVKVIKLEKRYLDVDKVKSQINNTTKR
jgi:adenylate kinase family enzyme